MSSSSETRSKIPRKVPGQSGAHPTHQSYSGHAVKSIPRGQQHPGQNAARSGRTYTMLEENERALKQQLYERDQRLRETQQRQEVY